MAAAKFDKNGGSSKGSKTDNKKRHNKSPSKGVSKKAKTSDTSSFTPRQRKHADIVTESKILWNQLRQKSNTPEQRRQILDKLWPLIQGKARAIALQHDAARVVQAVLQFGTPEERMSLIKELCANDNDTGSKTEKTNSNNNSGGLAELCKSQYAHFCVLKAIQYSDKLPQAQHLMVTNLKGHFSKLAMHAVGARVVEALWTEFPRKLLQPLVLELYGPHMTLFANNINTSSDNKQPPQQPTSLISLQHCLDQAPQHKQACLDFVQQLLHKGMEKNLYALEFFQYLLGEYCCAVDGTTLRQLLTAHATATDNVIHLLSTRHGVRAACEWVAWGTAKDRKNILKALKGYAGAGLQHVQAYLVYLQLVLCTDDTKMIHKQILQELLTKPTESSSTNDDNGDKEQTPPHPLLELALHERASLLFSFILCLTDSTRLQKLLDPYDWQVLRLSSSANNQQRAPLIDGEPTWKKDVAVKQSELIQQYLGQPLMEMVQQHAVELLTSRPGAAVVRHVYQYYATTSHKSTKDVLTSLATAIAQAAVEDTLLDHVVGHVALKHILLDEAERSTHTFAQALVDAMEDSKQQLPDVALQSNRQAFVMAALVKAWPEAKQHFDTKTLQKHQQGKAAAGIKALLQELQ